MSLKRQIAFNTVFQISGKAISTLLGVLTVMIMTRSLGVEQFGWYITASSFLQFFGIFSDFGFTVVTANMLGEPHFEKRRLLNTIFTWRFITALIFNGLAPLVILFFPYPTPIKIAAAILSVSFFTVYLNQIFIAYYQAELKTHTQAIAEILGRLTLLIGAFLISRQNYGFLPMVSVVTIAAIVNTLYLWLHSRGLRFQIDREVSRALWKKIWPVALSVIFNAFYLQGDKIILSLHDSQANVGLYGAAVRVVETIIPIPSLLMGMMLPLLTASWSQNKKAEFRERQQWSFTLVNTFLLPIIAGAIVISQPIMVFVAGKNFSGSGAILNILAWKMLGLSFGIVFGYILLAINRQKQAMWVYLADAILSIIGFLYFIPRYGVSGAAGVSLFSELFAGLCLFSLAVYYSGTLPSFKNFFKISLASLLMGLALYTLQPLNIAWSVLLGALFYIGLILNFNVITKDMIKEILETKKISPEPTENPIV